MSHFPQGMIFDSISLEMLIKPGLDTGRKTSLSKLTTDLDTRCVSTCSPLI